MQQLLPINRFQIGAADVPKASRWFRTDIVSQLAGVADNHVVVADWFAVDEAVDVRFSDAAESAVVQLTPSSSSVP